jgi:hypothetical protein
MKAHQRQFCRARNACQRESDGFARIALGSLAE